jgi:hypothetical protein
VKGMRVAGVCTLEAANAHLENEFLPRLERDLDGAAGRPCGRASAARQEHNLVAILSHVEPRHVPRLPAGSRLAVRPDPALRPPAAFPIRRALPTSPRAD